MSCPFCFVNQKATKMTYETASSLIEKYSPKTIIYHGGEPLLCPEVILRLIEDFPDVEHSITTNFTLGLSDKRQEILNRVDYISTSYSVDRFSNNNLYKTFLDNVKKVNKQITLLVTLSKEQLRQPPVELAKIISEINPTYVDLERLYDKEMPASFYKETDDYMVKMFRLIPKEKNALYLRMKGAIKYKTKVFNQKCNQSVVVANPDGRTFFCPNMSNSEVVEKRQDKECLTCSINEYCGGDCLSFKGFCKFPKQTFLNILKEE